MGSLKVKSLLTIMINIIYRTFKVSVFLTLIFHEVFQNNKVFK